MFSIHSPSVTLTTACIVMNYALSDSINFAFVVFCCGSCPVPSLSSVNGHCIGADHVPLS